LANRNQHDEAANSSYELTNVYHKFLHEPPLLLS
jgi:hypothetical protein